LNLADFYKDFSLGFVDPGPFVVMFCLDDDVYLDCVMDAKYRLEQTDQVETDNQVNKAVKGLVFSFLSLSEKVVQVSRFRYVFLNNHAVLFFFFFLHNVLFQKEDHGQTKDRRSVQTLVLILPVEDQEDEDGAEEKKTDQGEVVRESVSSRVPGTSDSQL
jgi:hypothetical protein